MSAAKLGSLLELALDRAEREVDDRRQLRRHFPDLFVLADRQVVLRRHTDLNQHAVTVALVVGAVLARQRDVAASDAVRELVEPGDALEDVALEPLSALDLVKDDLRRSLHTRVSGADFPSSLLIRFRRFDFTGPRAYKSEGYSSSE